MKCRVVCLTCLLAAFFCARAANAAVIMTLEQVGPNTVFATATGTVNLTGLSFVNPFFSTPMIDPINAILGVGPMVLGDLYTSISGPASFGVGGLIPASTGTGNALDLPGDDFISVPSGYVSGTLLSGTATWNNTNLTALGVTDGIYTWTWGSGADADSLTLYAGVPAPVPEPAPAFLLTLAAAALALLTRTRDWRLCPKRRNVS